MVKKIIWCVVVIVVVPSLVFIAYKQMNSNEYVPTEDEIALHIQFDTEEAVGLLIYDYCASGHTYSGGISNADGTLINNDSEIIVVWNKEELNTSSDTFELSMQFRIITEYVTPNYENIYPDDITKCLEPISWEAHFGESYFITIIGDIVTGYAAALN